MKKILLISFFFISALYSVDGSDELSEGIITDDYGCVVLSQDESEFLQSFNLLSKDQRLKKYQDCFEDNKKLQDILNIKNPLSNLKEDASDEFLASQMINCQRSNKSLMGVLDNKHCFCISDFEKLNQDSNITVPVEGENSEEEDDNTIDLFRI